YRPLDEYRRWMQEGVYFLGALPPPNLALELARSALLVHPSNSTEASCIAAIEAQAAGTPVVASAYGALPETVQDGRTGVVVPGRVETEEFNRRFADAVADLLLNPQRREELGRAARQRALSYYSWDAIAQEWLAKLAQLLQQKAAPFRQSKPLLSV
ncbi:MAG: glycosyltransferase, partial [Bacillota bacterium]|nr:glycosyltransferase [Bacillota bacterium]